MAGLSLTQIINRLNEEFTGDTRKLVFWYDDNSEFVEDMQNVTLDNAKVYFLRPDNQFATKLFLERTDTITNYLIYAPFPKPDVRDNHLEDTLLYSKRFFADRASLLSVDLGIDEKYKPVIEKYIKFFASKERTQRFYDLEIENFNEENIITGLLSAICRTRTCSFEEVIRVMLTDSSLEDNKFLIEIEKYGLLSDFWKLCEQHFGYADVKPTLEKLVVTMFVTYTAKYVPSELPKPWRAFSSYKAGNIIAFMDNLMNNILYRSRYDELSAYVAAGLNAQTVFSDYPPEDLVGCDTFAVIDQILIKWLVERLVAEDTGAKLDGLTIPQLCEKRSKMHFGELAGSRYQMLSSAYRMIQAGNYHCPDSSQHTWMFISSFDGLRRKMLRCNWCNLVHLGTKAFEAIGGEVVQTVAFIFRKRMLRDYRSIGSRLVDYDLAEAKEMAFLNHKDEYTFHSNNFELLPGNPYVYWLSDKYYLPFDSAQAIENYVETILCKKVGALGVIMVITNMCFVLRIYINPKRQMFL